MNEREGRGNGGRKGGGEGEWRKEGKWVRTRASETEIRGSTVSKLFVLLLA